MSPIYATAVTRRVSSGWKGVLLTGPSGSGKSDLALRLIARGWRLVSDDYSHVWASGGRLYATAPDTIAGQMEIRGLGIMALPHRSLTPVQLVVTCQQQTVERLPEPSTIELTGLRLAVMAVDIRPASACEVVERAVSTL